jgi:hypothetical protein
MDTSPDTKSGACSIEPSLWRSTMGDLEFDRSPSRGRPISAKLFVRRKKFRPLEIFFCFSNFFAKPERRFLEADMAMGELFAVTTLISIALMIAAYWQSDDDGGLV